jgi:hypothetical protein
MMFYPQTKALLDGSERIALEKDFGQGLKLYKYSPTTNFTLVEKVTNFLLFKRFLI